MTQNDHPQGESSAPSILHPAKSLLVGICQLGLQSQGVQTDSEHCSQCEVLGPLARLASSTVQHRLLTSHGMDRRAGPPPASPARKHTLEVRPMFQVASLLPSKCLIQSGSIASAATCQSATAVCACPAQRPWRQEACLASGQGQLLDRAAGYLSPAQAAAWSAQQYCPGVHPIQGTANFTHCLMRVMALVNTLTAACLQLPLCPWSPVATCIQGHIFPMTLTPLPGLQRH